VKVIDPIIFGIREYAALADGIAVAGNFTRGKITAKSFADGEDYHRIETEVVKRHVVVVGGTVDDRSTLEIYDVASGLISFGVESLTLVIPYFGYSTMERAVKRGEIVKAKTRARLLSSIPYAAQGNRLLLLDLHAAGIPHYFEGAVRAVHVYAEDLVIAAARSLAGDDFVFACTDAGRAKWVESLANKIGVDAAFVFKRRVDGNTTQITGVSAKVEGRNVVIYDDMIRTGGSLIDAGRAYRDAGARKLWAIATHGVFPGDALARIEATKIFESIVVTDSHPRAVASSFLRVDSVARLYAEKILE